MKLSLLFADCFASQHKNGRTMKINRRTAMKIKGDQNEDKWENDNENKLQKWTRDM